MDVCNVCREPIRPEEWSLTDVVRVRDGLHEVRHFCSDDCYGAWDESEGDERSLTATLK